MKRLFLIAATVVNCGIIFAASFISVGSLSTVNNTTLNGTSGIAGTITLPGGYYLVQNNGLTATNALLGNLQVSTDNTNFTTIGTYNPSVTNAATDRVFMPSSSSITVYYRMQIVTTNSVQVGVNFIQ